VKTVAVTPDPQMNVELEIPHEPFDDARVNPEPFRDYVSISASRVSY
jgi:hypothetical protein